MNRILLADDSPHAQRMGERILADEGYEVITVSDGDSALIRLEDVDPDLVLTDLMMPKRSGFEVCQYVKLSPRHRRTRVVLTLGALENLDQEEYRRVRADAFVRKPFEASVLLEVVKPLIEAANLEDTAGGERQTSGAGAKSAVSGPPQRIVVVLDAEKVRAAVTLALDASMSDMIDQITEKVLAALSKT